MAEDKISFRLEKLESECASNESRMSDLEIDIKELRETHLSLIKMANSLEEIHQTIESQKDESETITEPTESPKVNVVETIVDRLAWIVIGGGFVYLLYHILGGSL